MLRSKYEIDKNAYYCSRDKYTASLNNARSTNAFLNLLTKFREIQENSLKLRSHFAIHLSRTASLYRYLLIHD